MKSISKLIATLILLTSLCTYSATIKFIIHPKHQALGEYMKNTFIKEYSIPGEIIEVQISSLSRDELPIDTEELTIYLNEQGDTQVISKNSKELLDSLRTFQQE